MMRKLAVTVFAISLTALGCGSDSGTPVKNDAGDARAPSAEVGQTADGPAKDVAAAETTTSIDTAKPDLPTTEAAQVVEAGQVIEAGQNLDVKRDTATPIDGTPHVDGGAVDASQDVAQPDAADANVGEAGTIDVGTGEAGSVDTGVTG